MIFPLMSMLVGISTVLVVWIGGRQVIAGTITIGNIAEFIIYVNLLTWPIASLGWVTSLVQRAAASQERINEFLRIKPEIADEKISRGREEISKPADDRQLRAAGAAVITGKIEFK